MKCTTRALAISRYGGIDFASKFWRDQHTWIEMFLVPPGWFPGWKIEGTNHPVEHIALNKDVHVPLFNALVAIKKNGLGALLYTFDGCFNIRMVRGTDNSPSCHAYGLALDINASQNTLGSTHGGFYQHPELIKCFTDEGFDWGGNFKHRKDPMHFSFAWE